MRRVSLKTQRKQADRKRAIAIATERQHGRCAGLDLLQAHVCHGPLVGHEPLKRSRGGDACDPDEVMMVCAWLNIWIEDHDIEATEAGLSISGSTLYRNGRYLKRSER